MTHDPLAWIDGELSQWRALGLQREPMPRSGPQQARIVVGSRELLNFGSNDYLGIASDSRLVAAARRAAEQEGWGSGASPLVTGLSQSHIELQDRLAKFEATESALVFNSGFAANVGTLSALAGSGDIILSDQKNHASIIDGSRLSGARVQVYPHSDVDYLEMMLKQASPFRRRLIVTDGLFSMDGDLAPLVELAELAERYDAMLMVDEAHSTGLFGDHGRGVSEYLRVESGVHVRVGTLSKALGCSGGFVSGPRNLIDWLYNRSRSYVFSTAPPPAACQAAIAAIDLVEQFPQRRRELLSSAAGLRRVLTSQGWEIGQSQSQIIPIYLGSAELTMQAGSRLREAGLFVPGIRPPSVPEGESLLRLSLSYAHSEDMIAQLTQEMAQLRQWIGTATQFDK